MRPSLLLAAVLLAPLTPLAPAAEDEAAIAILREAARSQGDVRAEDIRDVLVEFRGEIVEETTHAVERTYWYRTPDRSFRIRTEPPAARKERTERGVLGEKGYWDRAADGSRVDLARTNRDHRELIRTIESERADFERILRMVLLPRLLDGKSRVTLAEPLPGVADLGRRATRRCPPSGRRPAARPAGSSGSSCPAAPSRRTPPARAPAARPPRAGRRRRRWSGRRP